MAFLMKAAEVFRDFVTGGVPSSGKWDPKKSDIRAWGNWIEEIIAAFFSTGGKIYQTRALLNADLTPAANSIAWVMEDPTVANNGVYRKVGASGAGSWVRAGDLPFSFIVASNPGAGSANAIQATTSIPVSSSALVWLNIATANTSSPVTVSFNGGSPLTVKTNSGNDVVAGGLVAGMIVMGIVSGSTFRLISDQISTAIVAAAEAVLKEFKKTYFGALSADPTVDPYGDPLTAGDVYFNTSSLVLKVYNGSSWLTVQATSFATQAQAVAGTATDVALDPLRGAKLLEGYAFKSQSSGAFSRSLPVRFGDVIDLAEFIDPSENSHAANAARVNALLSSGAVTDRTVVKFPKGVNRLKKITFPNNINFFRVVGDWPASVLEFDETSENWIQLGGNCDYFAQSGLNIQKKPGNVLTGGTAIALADGSGWYEPLFEEILIYQPYQGMQIGTISSASPADVCHLPTLRGVSIREAVDNSFVFGQCYDPRLTECYSGKAFGGSVVGTGFLFTDWCQAGYARQCQALGGDYGWRWGDGDGTDVSINAMDISGCVGDNAKSASFAALGIDRLKINGFGASQQTGAYVVLIGNYAREVCLDNFYGENGARDIVSIAAGARRTEIRGGYYVSGSLDAANTYAGIRAQDNAQDFQIDGVRAFNKTGYYSGQQAHGVAIGTGCDGYMLVNSNLRGNQTAGINNASSGAANKVIANNLT